MSCRTHFNTRIFKCTCVVQRISERVKCRCVVERVSERIKCRCVVPRRCAVVCKDIYLLGCTNYYVSDRVSILIVDWGILSSQVCDWSLESRESAIEVMSRETNRRPTDGGDPYQKIPMLYQKSPILYQKSPIFYQTSSISYSTDGGDRT